MSSTQLCWLDCDPGHDDSFAIILAAYSENIKLIGISTVSGNQTIEKTTENALNVMNLAGLISKSSNNDTKKLELVDLKGSLAYAGMICPLIQGSPRPLLRAGKICDEIHGDTGLNTHVSIQLPQIPSHAKNYVNHINSQSTSIHFTTQMYAYIRSFAPKKVTFITTGPLTNIALLLINHPQVVQHIEKLILMGGAVGCGNTGPAAEFNIQVDPEAASYVFESEIPIYMVPLEVTHTAIVTTSVLDRIAKIESNFSKIMIELLLFFKSTYQDVFFMSEPPLHDPCAVAYAINASIFESKLMRVDIETHSLLSYGQTVCDIYGMSKNKKNVNVCNRMDVDRFWDMIIDSLEKANKKSPANIEA